MAPKDKKQPPLAPSDWKEFTEDQEDEMQFELALHRHFDDVREESMPPAKLLDRLDQIPTHKPQQEPTPPWWKPWTLPVLATVLAALGLLLWLGPRFGNQRTNSHLIVKGSQVKIHLEFARKQGLTRIRRKANKAQSLQPGDLLQFVYTQPTKLSKTPTYVMIISLQESGEMTVLAPFQGKRSIKLSSPTGTFPRGESLEVGSENGKEALFGLVSDKPFQADQVRSALQRAFNKAEKTLHQVPSIQGPWQQVWKQLIYKKGTKKQ